MNLPPSGIAAGFYGALAASALAIGALVVLWRKPSSLTIGLIMGFGAGALVSSIAYELVPESVISGTFQLGLAFALGAIVFFVADWWIDRRGGAQRKSIQGDKGGSGASIFIGSLLDAIPESLILGIGIAIGGVVSLAFLVAIFVSNVPEGMAGTINLLAAGHSRKSVIWMWSGVVLTSAVSAAVGYFFVGAIPGTDGRFVQAFAAGALLTMLADAMMPEAFEHGGKAVGLLTVMGFLVAAILSVQA
jgi:ZIP family zinc transporter